MSSSSEDILGKFAVVMWSIWRCRNDLLWNNARCDPRKAVYSGLEFLCSWLQARNTIPNSMTTPSGVDPLNLFEMQHRCCTFRRKQFHWIWNGLVRDSDGHVVACRTALYPALLQVREAEAMCLLEAISWVLPMGFKDVTFETDAQVVVHAIKTPNIDLSEFGSLISARISKLNIEYISFARRQANKVAHALDRVTCSYANPTICMIIPSFLSSLISNGCNNSTFE
ncbi:hypothetical protein DITRI_Ditri13aG0092000 [Diplodiscus trichospermus]